MRGVEGVLLCVVLGFVDSRWHFYEKKGFRRIRKTDFGIMQYAIS
jgi:hypothetical protein